MVHIKDSQLRNLQSSEVKNEHQTLKHIPNLGKKMAK